MKISITKRNERSFWFFRMIVTRLMMKIKLIWFIEKTINFLCFQE